MSNSAPQLSLNGRWSYAPLAHAVLREDGTLEDVEGALPPQGDMTLPANWNRAGLTNFHGRVKFERTFEFSGLQDDERSAWLVFRGVDYYAQVWVNGSFVGSHEGYFQPFRFDVTRLLQEGDNIVTVEVACPKEDPETLWPDRKMMLKGILSHWDCRPGSWHKETGQDDNSGGIWADVYLETLPKAYLNHMSVTTKLLPDALPDEWNAGFEFDASHYPLQAVVRFACELFAEPGTYTLRASVGSHMAEMQVHQALPVEKHALDVWVSDPALWWTWDLGEPTLQTCEVQVSQGDTPIFTERLETGLREVHLDKETGIWYLNGKRLFVRGTNIVPTLWLGEYGEEEIGRDVRLLKEAHVNGVRVCVHVNRDELYDALDRAGILVWQDFPFQWGYNASPSFMREAVRQAKDMVRLLVNHPSVALWCAENESGVFNDHVLAPLMADAIASEDISRTIHPVSEFSEHLYYGWYHGDYHQYAGLPGGNIISELGAQALPNLEQTRAMFGSAWPPDWDKLGYHNFQYHETFAVAGIETGGSWETFVRNSQTYQANVLKAAIERYRRTKYRSVGSFFQFMFMDCWPSVTWSVLDHERQPKLGFHALQRAFQPVLVGLDLEDLTRARVSAGPLQVGAHRRPAPLRAWVVNDLHYAYEGCRCRVRIDALGIELRSDPFDVPSDAVVDASVLQLEVPTEVAPGTYELVSELMQGEEVLSVNTYEVHFSSMDR